MDKICESEKCTSCLACYSICPVEAISITTDAQGFYRPCVDNNICIDCFLCQKVCPTNTIPMHNNSPKEVFACFVKDEEIRSNSSSGGFFSQIANYFLNEGGIVFGAGFDENLQIEHFGVNTNKDLIKLRASKYVQSYIGNTFKQVKQLLTQGKKVLFSGTPCQISGLMGYLGNMDRQNLLLIDLVCHGVPSPKLYNDFLSYLQNEYLSKPVKVNFRYKPNGWKSFGMRVDFANSEIYFKDLFEDPYLIGFLKNFFLNPACYTCQFANTNRPGDITIADFWGYHNNDELFDDDKGITLVITNNTKGINAYKLIESELAATNKTLAEAVAGNASLVKPTFKNKRYEEFWQDYNKDDFISLIQKFFLPRKRPNH